MERRTLQASSDLILLSTFCIFYIIILFIYLLLSGNHLDLGLYLVTVNKHDVFYCYFHHGLCYIFCRSTGFILEGFPRNSEECQFILQKGYFVDAALWLNIDENDVIDRIFPMRFQLWKDCRDLQLLKQQKIQERKKQIRVWYNFYLSQAVDSHSFVLLFMFVLLFNIRYFS